MVSRSLEKMLLVAIGLSTAVLIGVPVLMYAMDTLGTASQLERASLFADRVHNVTGSVNDGLANNIAIEIHVPDGIVIASVGTTLTIMFEMEGLETRTWSVAYDHSIVLVGPSDSGPYIMHVQLDSGTIEIAFSSVI
ncbi:MAG: hypothetical protein AM324_001240 [Candidatus Thorarchaeota archaeon SMTZ1-83]|nr:MAG: hypothetical protein AM324_02150 [Candidatus Thorarchaeota archaeon SMTZ1-83]